MSTGEHKSETFLKLNARGTVPVVSDGGFVMHESRAIICYLADAKSPGNTLYPADDHKARFIIDQKLFYDASTFSPAIGEIYVSSNYFFLDFEIIKRLSFTESSIEKKNYSHSTRN